MTEFRIIEARPHHCGQMVRLLRAEAAGAMRRERANLHRELRDCFDQSIWFRRAWLIGDKLGAVGGVTGSALSSAGVIWLALSDDAARRYPIATAREARRQIAEITRTWRCLSAAILLTDAPSFRFARHLGFRVDPSVDCETFEGAVMRYDAEAA